MSKTATTVEALSVAVAADTPTILWGTAGTGKTSSIEAMGQEAGYHVETVIASIREPSDFSGLPIVADEGDRVHLAPPAWALRLIEADAQGIPGLLFFDEISTAPPAVQAALLRVILGRWVGDIQLPATTRIVAAANPPDEAADGWDLAGPLANRFVHLDWSLDAQDWSAGMIAGFQAPRIPKFNQDAYESALVKARGTVSAYMQIRPTDLSNPPDNESAAGRAWPSPRSWDMVSRLLAAAEACNASADATRDLVCGAIGIGKGIEFLTWREELDLPDPEAVLKDPEGFDLDVRRGDRAFAILSAITAAIISNNTVSRWESGWTVMAKAVDAGVPDVAAIAARSLAQNRPDGARVPQAAAAFAPILKSAGILPDNKK